MVEYKAGFARLGARARHLGALVARTVADRLDPGASPLASSPADTTPAPAPPPRIPATAPPRPLPHGWDEAEIREVMASFLVDGSAPGELTPYVDDALWRFLHTWGLVRAEGGKALELGGNPYFLTWLLRDFTELELTVANYFGGPNGVANQKVEYRCRDADLSFDVAYDIFNLEEDQFPYPDDSFQVALFCEIIEHLLMDPLHALREINRVLEPGGLLVLTTPNVARIGNVLALLDGANIYDPYSGFGPYGRHNREFTRRELRQLLTFAGFDERQSFTADAHLSDVVSLSGYELVGPPLIERRGEDLGQYHFITAAKARQPRDGLPTAFYRSWPAERLVVM